MTGQPQTQPGDLVAIREQAAVTPPRGTAVASAADLSNVIPFARARRSAPESHAPLVTISPADRPVPPLPGTRPWLHAVLVGCSLVVHSGLFYAFWQEPKPLPGIGIEAMTVDVIIIGDDKPAGAAATPGESQVQSVEVQEVKPDEKAVEEDQAAEAREVKPVETRTEAAKDEAVEQPQEQQPEQRQDIAMVETPQAEISTVQPRETPPDMQAVIVPPREQPKEVKPEPKQKQKKAARPSERSEAASGSGPRSVSSEANYNGRVSAHLRRYQQYPAAARNAGITGTGTVTFAIGSSGSVTSVSIVRGSGAVVLDQEIAAMVRRASPFPPPPDGQPKSFTVPVRFNLQQ